MTADTCTWLAKKNHTLRLIRQCLINDATIVAIMASKHIFKLAAVNVVIRNVYKI